MHVLLTTKIVIAPVCIEVCVCPPHSTAEGSLSVFKATREARGHTLLPPWRAGSADAWKTSVFSFLSPERTEREKSISSLPLARHASCIYWYFACMLLKTLLNLDCQSDKPHHLPFVLSGAPVFAGRRMFYWTGRVSFMGFWNMPSHIWLLNVFFNTSRDVNTTLRGLQIEIRARSLSVPPVCNQSRDLRFTVTKVWNPLNERLLPCQRLSPEDSGRLRLTSGMQFFTANPCCAYPQK